MRRRLPPLTTLEGFEAAARLGSFSAAAGALGLTQSAISHQIRQLEEALGQPVFRRLHRKVVLTDAGRDFQRSVGDILDLLREGVTRLEPYRRPGSVVVYCDPALASGWLVQKLPALKTRHPRVDVWLDTSGRLVDFGRDEVDILIRRHRVDRMPLFPSQVVVEKFAEETLRPVGAARLAAELRQRRPLDWPGSLALLHDESFDGWPQWFARHGGGAAPADISLLQAGANFSDGFVMLQAATAGLGIALGSTVVAEGMVRSRQLAWLSADEIASPHAFLVATTENALRDPDTRATFDWLRSLPRQAGRQQLPGDF
jgi:LysR family glycine cleavage system transcriptional activator